MWKHRYKPEDFSYGVIPYHTQDTTISYLLIQHRAGHWAFPKGHMDQWESKIQTALRELQEETWIMSEDIILTDTDTRYTEHYKFAYRGASVRKTVQYILWQCQTQIEINPQATELQDARRCSYHEALQLITFPVGQELLSKVHKILQSSWI